MWKGKPKCCAGIKHTCTINKIPGDLLQSLITGELLDLIRKFDLMMKNFLNIIIWWLNFVNYTLRVHCQKFMNLCV